MAVVSRQFRTKVTLSAALLWMLTCPPVRGSDTITIATGEWPPYISTKQPQTGCMADLIRQSFAKSGMAVEFHFMDWSAAYRKAKKGEYDATAYWYDRADRRIDFLLPRHAVIREANYFFYHKDAPVTFNSWPDLSGKTVIINKGMTYSQVFFDRLKQHNINTYIITDQQSGFDLLYRRRGDLTVASNKPSFAQLNQLPPRVSKYLVRLPKPAFTNQGYLLISRMSTQLNRYRKAFDQGFEQLMVKPGYRENYTRHCAPLD